MKFATTRFGELEVDDRDVFHFPDGIIGFPEMQRLVVLPHSPDSPFKWLQAVDHPELAFVVIDPFLLDPNYPMDMLIEALSDDDYTPTDIGAASIAVVPPAPNPITVNLLAPVVLDPQRRVGRQIILNGTSYLTRHVLVQEDPVEEGDHSQTATAP